MNLLKSIYRALITAVIWLFVPLWILAVFFVVLFQKMRLTLTKNQARKNPRLLWGTDTIINNRYWANAMKENGYQAASFVFEGSSYICKSEEYDRTLESTVPFYFFWKKPVIHKFLGTFVFRRWTPYSAFIYATANFDIFHFSFNGGALRGTVLEKLEPTLLKYCGKKIVVSPFGGDAYCYSEIKDPSLQQGLLMSQFAPALETRSIKKKIEFWTKHADAIISGGAIDGLPRWDVLSQNHLVIDLNVWKPKSSYSSADGKSGVVKVVHTPNHRGFKGTEFLIQAVRELKEEGLKIDLMLLEGVENKEVRRILKEEADILAEQFIYSGYALSGIEGMASGAAVIANLETEVYAKLFKRYSFLGECPIVSAPVEKIKERLQFLVTHPEVREVIGKAGRRYVEKYHSPAAANYLFGSIYRKIWFKEEVDLLKLYHPLFSDYVKTNPVKGSAL